MIQASRKMKAVKQFSYCDICRENNQDRNKHMYSKKHRDSISKVLGKFKEKIDLAKGTLQSPVIKGKNFEDNSTFWCYFCAREIKKHWSDDEVTVLNGGIVSHLCGIKHARLASKYWRRHGIQDVQQEQFVFEQELWNKFQLTMKNHIVEFLDKKNDNFKKQVEDFRNIELERRSIAMSSRTELCNQKASSSHLPKDSNITPRNEKAIGNIFSGATPPWMDDSPGPSSLHIGPSAQDLKIHKELEKNKALPVNRLGANFDRKTSLSRDWLPEFGRVWNNGQRWKSKRQFLNERKNAKSSGYGEVRDISKLRENKSLPQQKKLFSVDKYVL